MTQTATPGPAAGALQTSTAPPRAGLVLALILVAAVANLNLAVAS